MIKILFIAPLPPPITGHSLAFQALLEELQKHYIVEIINYNKGTLKQGLNSSKRVIEVLKILYDIWIKKRDTDVIYLTISQTLVGNIKDLLIYSICFRKLSKMIIHLHGGGIKKLIFDKHKILYMLNKFFIRRLGATVVLGKSLTSIFKDMISKDRIYVVPNFAEDYLFLNKEEILEKFKNMNPLRILFLSNLIPGKGHEDLLEAYSYLDKDLQKFIRIDFAGDFESEDQKGKFLNKIKRIEGVKYHGVVYGEKKRELFSNAHVFCLPTYYYYEGQPISILEAYASGCVVITTNHGGICDIFADGENGFYVEKRSPHSIKVTLEMILERKEILLEIALRNQQFAERNFRKSVHLEKMNKIVLEVVQNDVKRHE
jgi:glycosyltransferase involved in cell wall biosynthesis